MNQIFLLKKTDHVDLEWKKIVPLFSSQTFSGRWYYPLVYFVVLTHVCARQDSNKECGQERIPHLYPRDVTRVVDVNMKVGTTSPLCSCRVAAVPPRLRCENRGIYEPAFRRLVTKSDAELGLRENDYVFGDLKVCGIFGI